MPLDPIESVCSGLINLVDPLEAKEQLRARVPIRVGLPDVVNGPVDQIEVEGVQKLSVLICDAELPWPLRRI